MNVGVYTQEYRIVDTMKTFQQYNILFPKEGNATTNNIIRQSMGYDMIKQSLRFKYLIDKYTIEKIVKDECLV